MGVPTLNYICPINWAEVLTSGSTGGPVASIRISNGSPLVYYDHYTKLHIVASGPVEPSVTL